MVMVLSTKNPAVGIVALALAGIALWLGTRLVRTDGNHEGASRAAAGSPIPGAGSAQDWYARGNEILAEGKDLAGAAEAYRKAIESAPSMGAAHYGLGYVLFRMDDVEGSLAEIESALTLAPEGAAWREDAENLFVRLNVLNAQREKR